MRQARAGHDTCGQRVTPRCRWAAGPGRTTSRRAERSSRRGRLTGGSPPTGTHSDQAPQVWRAPEGPEGTGGLRDNAPRHTPACQSPPMWRGVGGTGGPGCGARGRGQGLAGQRADAPSEARGADGSRAGRHPPAHTATRHHRCGGRRRVRRARAGFEIDHSEPQARVWRSRGRPGPTAPGTPVGPQATQAGRPPPTGTPSSPAQQDAQSARPNNTPRGARNASGATRNTAQGRGPAGPRP